MSPVLSLDRDGAELLPGAAAACLEQIEAVLGDEMLAAAGLRISGNAPLATLLSAEGSVGAIAAGWFDGPAQPVRAILFDKRAASNWALGWHQDRTIVVRECRDVPGYGPWTVKHDMQHVAPPTDLLAGMRTLRVHLDPVPSTNAPLLVAPGSHRHGKIPESRVEAIVAQCGTIACLAERGDIWTYATLILHASARATIPAGRRVLQVDYCDQSLPGGLEWLGV